jgi:hypothetical protein
MSSSCAPPSAELDALEAQRAQSDLQKQDQQDAAIQAQRDKALEDARRKAEQDVISSRENAIAIAAVLLAAGVLAAGGAAMFHNSGKTEARNRAAAGGVVLLLGAGAVFFLRPSFASVDDRIVLPANMTDAAPVTGATYDATGDNLCRIDESRSRITVSDIADVPVHWTPDGCVNGVTQYAQDNEGWSRILVPGTDATISVNSFDPATGTYRSERYLADAPTITQARALRAKYTIGACTTDAARLTELAQMQAQVRAILPPQPNERLVYHCNKAPPPKQE